MTAVRTAAFDLSTRGMTTMFGNPGSTELPMLEGFPSDLPLRAGAAGGGVVGMNVLPADAIVVLESPSSTPALGNRLRISRPGSDFFGAGGGLGFGGPAAIGVQLAVKDRPVVCVLGEGSAQ